MSILYNFLVLVHLLSAVAIVGSWFVNFKQPTVTSLQFYGAIAALLAGLTIAATREINDWPLNHVKIAVKLLIALGVFVAAFIGRRKVKNNQPVSAGIAHAVGGGALINVIIAVMWK